MSFFPRLILSKNLPHLSLKLKALDLLFIIVSHIINIIFLPIAPYFLMNKETKYLFNIYYTKIYSFLLCGNLFI